MYKLNTIVLLIAIERQSLKRWWVAEQAGIHVTTLRRILDGTSAKSSRDTVESLCKVLNLQPSQVVEGS